MTNEEAKTLIINQGYADDDEAAEKIRLNIISEPCFTKYEIQGLDSEGNWIGYGEDTKGITQEFFNFIKGKNKET
tara:strand:+ start:1111 stop:1335 length:225 start_codon:yes stop_codon:yes gene_type:complete